MLSMVSFAGNQAALLAKQAPMLNSQVIKLALEAYNKAEKRGYSRSPLLAIVDYALPSSKRRLWVFNLKTDQLLFYTYVAQGVNTGVNWAHHFSNRPGSYASSLGLYKTDNAYYGQWGYALRITGLESGYNNNAYQRDIVIHGGSYVTQRFIQQHGYAGNSHGCFVVSSKLARPIINTLKNGSLLFVFYPNKAWLEHSKFV